MQLGGPLEYPYLHGSTAVTGQTLPLTYPVLWHPPGNNVSDTTFRGRRQVELWRCVAWYIDEHYARRSTLRSL